MADLEYPNHPDELYIARGDEVSPYRPLMQGDVFLGVEIPGVDDVEDPNLAIVVHHPCSMRKGHLLVEKLKMVRLRPKAKIPLTSWGSGHYRVMPLPDVLGDESFYVASLDEIGLVQATGLDPRQRMACLAPRGLALMQQRIVHCDTRVKVDTPVLLQRSEADLEEAELLEEWNEQLAGSSSAGDFVDKLDQEAQVFDDLLSEERPGEDDAPPYTLRDLLKVPGCRSFVRSQVRKAIKERQDSRS